MHEGQVGQASPFMHFHGGHEPAQQAIASQPPLLQRNVAAAYTSFLNPHSSGELSPVPNSPPTTPPRSAQKTRTACQRSPTKTPLRVQGEVQQCTGCPEGGKRPRSAWQYCIARHSGIG